MDIFEKLGIKKYINAHDTYTIYGGSRMAPEVLEAMAQISRHFVDLGQLQANLGQRIAKMTRNEAAYITNGASGGLLLAASVAMAQGNRYAFSLLPARTQEKALQPVCGQVPAFAGRKGPKTEIILMRAQRNAYDKAIEAAGARIVEIGDADETLEYEMEGRIGDETGAVFYFAASLYQRGSLELEKTIEIAHGKGVPVVVDAAAQLPPVENLWKFTQMGADLVIFSGGKAICGPQDSGLLLGRKNLIEDCRRFGAPAHGVCRSSKTSREAMVGLYVALEAFLAKDPQKEWEKWMDINARISRYVEACPAVVKTEVAPKGPVGQDYPRLFIHLKGEGAASLVKKRMGEKGIYIGKEPGEKAIYISPLNLGDEEADQVGRALAKELSFLP